MKRVLGLGIAAIGLVLTATAAAPGPTAVGLLSPQEVVRARQAAYGLSAGMFGAMKVAIDSGADVKPLAFGATMLVRWARALPTLFPQGSNVAPTNARREVWTNRALFSEKALAYATASAKLAELARSGDKAAFAAQWAEVRANCQSCHDAFRKK